jgi:hypothetical protein
MRVPEFTAEASLHQPRGNYAGYSTSTGHAGIGSVVAQFDFTTLGNDYWPWLAELYDKCPPPFCKLDSSNHCHCLTDSLNLTNPRQ